MEELKLPREIASIAASIAASFEATIGQSGCAARDGSAHCSGGASDID